MKVSTSLAVAGAVVLGLVGISSIGAEDNKKRADDRLIGNSVASFVQGMCGDEVQSDPGILSFGQVQEILDRTTPETFCHEVEVISIATQARENGIS